MTMLDVRGVHFDYGDEPLLQGIDMTLEAGAALHVKGANGAGKTTFLKLLAGLLQPTEGEIKRHHAKQIAYVGHTSGVNMHLTPREHACFDLSLDTSNTSAAPIHHALQRLMLVDVQDIPCALLSAGQRRRVGLLRLLCSEASLWLLDEPLVALDQASIQVLGDMVLEHGQSGGALVFTSHQPLLFRLPVLAELVP